MQPNKLQMLRVLITPDRIVLFIRTSKHLWCPVCVYLSFHTLLCQGVWNYPFYVFLKGRETQSQTAFIVNGVKCTTSSQKQDLTHCCLARGSKLTGNLKGRGCERKTMWSLSLHFFVTLCCPSITRVCTCFSLFSCSSRSHNMTPKQSTAIHHPYLSSWCV